MDDGKLTSVELTKAYIERIEALNKRGPGPERRHAVQPRRAQGGGARPTSGAPTGHLLGPADGLPILMKDLIDVKGMYTSAGNYSLRQSFPAHRRRHHQEAARARRRHPRQARPVGVREQLRQPAVGLLATSPARSSTASTPTRTRAARRRAPARPMAAALSMLGDRHRDLGLDHQPVADAGPRRPAPDRRARARLRHRADLGLAGHGRPDGPHASPNAALTLQSIAGPDPDSDAEYTGHLRAGLPRDRRHPAAARARCRTTCRRSTSNFVHGKKIGYNGTLTAGSPLKLAYDALVAAGAIMVPRPTTTVGTLPALPAGYEQHKTIDEYYKRLGPHGADPDPRRRRSPVNQAESQQALKFGNGSHLNSSLSDISPGRRPTRRSTGRTCPAQGGLAQGDRRHDELHELRSDAAARSGDRDPRQRRRAARRRATRRSRSRWATTRRPAARSTSRSTATPTTSAT